MHTFLTLQLRRKNVSTIEIYNYGVTPLLQCKAMYRCYLDVTATKVSLSIAVVCNTADMFNSDKVCVHGFWEHSWLSWYMYTWRLSLNTSWQFRLYIFYNQLYYVGNFVLSGIIQFGYFRIQTSMRSLQFHSNWPGKPQTSATFTLTLMTIESITTFI